MFTSSRYLVAFIICLGAALPALAGKADEAGAIRFAAGTEEAQQLSQVVAHGIEILQPKAMLSVLARQAAQSDPDSAYAHYLVSQAAFSKAESKRCLELARQAAAQSSEGERRFIEAALALALGDAETALSELMRLARDYPADRLVRMTLGQALLGLGYWEAALRHLQKARRLDSQTARVHVLLGQAHLQGKRFDEARQCLQEALRRLPSLPPEADWLVALVLLHQGEGERALQTLAQSPLGGETMD